MSVGAVRFFADGLVSHPQRSPGRGENHCFQKPRDPRLRVQRIVITRSLIRGSFERLHCFGPTLIVPIQIFASGSGEVSDAELQEAF